VERLSATERESATEELVKKAAAMVPTLRERSAECEELRRIPSETIDDIVSSGILRMAQPTRFEGLALGVDAVAEVAMEIGRGCPSSAWMFGQWPGHQFMAGMYQMEAQEEYFAQSPNTFSSTASAVVKMDVQPVDGGYVINSHTKFSSGVDAAEWIHLNTPIAQCLVPKSDFKIVDDWYVMGLRGTGSKAVVIDDAFVPEHRTVPLERLVRGASYGADLYPENPYYRSPFVLVLNTMLLGPVVGMARGLIEIFDERVRKRRDTHTLQPAFERPGTQLRFAEASAEVDAAALILRRICADLRALGEAGQEVSLPDRARLRRDVAYAAKLCIQAADRLLESGDASGMYDSSLLQRWARDIHMGALQFVLTWDEPAIAYSRVRWGLEPGVFTI
jgi:3-hydroxy-9,10-secoandrosta-1,3,5(10)-triene-9,17-dione monooxygenase